jgi:nitroimidazol reductase NimA-like FMN-containing flavoprotein (pyridoxamine 5'-phosphate oxidase superfamily)
VNATTRPAAGGELPVQHLDEALIRERLARARFARLAFVDGDQPIVVPVNITTDHAQRVVFHTAAAGLLGGLDGQRVAVEIDGHDAALRSGWSVLVLGVARDVTDAADRDAGQLRGVAVDSWAPGARARCFAVLPLSVSGRVIPIGEDGDWFAGVPGS